MHVYGDKTYKQYTDGECDIKTLVKVNREILTNATCTHDDKSWEKERLNYDEKLKKFKEDMKSMSENLFQTSNTRPFEEYKNYSKNSELLTPE